MGDSNGRGDDTRNCNRHVATSIREELATTPQEALDIVGDVDFDDN